MKTRFAKIISIAVALVMLVSLCLSAPLTVSAATVEVTVNNSGKVYTVDATVGQKLPKPTENANGMVFLGWYSDPACTVEYGEVQANETRKAYALYPSTYIPFNEKEYVVGTSIRDNSGNHSGAYLSSVVTDPANAGNKVFKLHSNDLYATVLLPQYDDASAAKYQLIDGHSYTISFKYKIPDSLTVASFDIRITQGDSCASSGAKRTAINSTQKTITVSSLNVGEWYTYTTTYTPSNTSVYTSPMISLYCAGTASSSFGANNYVYFDDVMITDNDFTYEIPADGSETSFEIGEYNKSASNAIAGDFASGTGLWSLSTAEAHSGSTSMVYNTAMQDTLRFVYAYTSTKNALKLESNKTYTITFWYKATAKSDWINIYLSLWNSTKSDDAYSNKTRTDIVKHSVAVTNEWTKVSFNYTVGDCSANPYIIMGITGGGSATKTVYIDDISVVEYVPFEVSDTYTSFEGCTVNHDNGFASTTSASISTEQAKSGISSLKIAPSGANIYRSYAYNDKDSALQLDSYTKYTVSYWYKATALQGSKTNVVLTLNGRGNVWGNNTLLNTTSIHGSTLGEWHEVVVSFITGDCSSSNLLTIGLETGAGGTVVYFDDVTVTYEKYIGMHDFYSDFSEDYSIYKLPNDNGNWAYYASNVNFNTDNGILTFPTTHNQKPSTVNAYYVQHFAPKNTAGNYGQIKSYTPYRITVRYKQTATNADATGYFSVGVKTAIPKSEAILSLVVSNEVGTTDWKEYTFDVVTGDLGNMKYLTLTFGTSAGTMTYEVDYIKVTEGPFLNNNGEIYKNTTAVGSEIATPTFDDDKYDFIGWYSDPECTVPFGVVRENETRTAYARYNKTVINFNEVEFIQKATYRDDGEKYGGYESGIVLDPTNATNKVFKLHSPAIWSNFVVPVYDAKNASAYPIIAGVEYTVSFDYMLPESVTADKLQLRILSGTGSTGGSRDPYDRETLRSYNVSEIEAGKWYSYSITFTARDSAANNPYLLIGYMLDGGSAKTDSASGIANYVYFDNVTVYNNAQFVKVTMNNRGTVSEVDAVVGTELAAINSNLDEQVFIGWYSDPECTVPYGAIQSNETRTAYAKYDTLKITFGNDNKQLNAGDTFNVPCYDGVNNALNLKANTTYAMRFILKPLKDSAAGKISVLGNEFKFNAYTAENANAWTPASITFTTTESTALQMSVVSNGNASVLVDDLIVYELDYTPETTVSAGNSTISATKPVAQNNMQTGKVIINLANGEQLKVGGLTITYDLYATAFSDFITSKIMLADGSYDLDRDNVAGNGNEFVYFVPANAKNIRISAEFVSSDENNIGIIAGSIREKTNEYNAGLRFRARVYNKTGIKKIGFILAPQKLVNDAGYEALTLENATACSAIVADATGVIYDKSDLFTDYQVILTNVDSLLNTAIQCVAYVEYEDGTVVYTDAKTQSYNSIKSAMQVERYGITSYYADEYKDTRDKLLQTQNDGTFSFLSLTDIHIDYIKTVADGEYWYTTPVGEELPDRYNIQREIAMVVEMANTTDVDCIILGGDLIHGTNGHASAMADLNYLAQVFQKAKVPVISARGNHDNNDYHGKPCALEHIITNEEWTTTLLTPLAKGVETVHGDTDEYSTYYYMDFPEKKTRVIVLDAWNYPIITTDGFHSVYGAENGWDMYGDDAQIEWFAKVALDAELQGWNYVLSTHAPISGNNYSGNSTNTQAIRAIIEAFNNKTTVNVLGTTMDYSSYDGQMPLNISGHTHIQSWRLLGDTLVGVNTASGRLAYYPNETLYDTENHKDFQPVRYEGTYSEACFDAVVYNPATSTIQRFNFGNRPDDKFVITDNGIEITEYPHEGFGE